MEEIGDICNKRTMKTIEEEARNYAGITEDKYANITHTCNKCDIAEAFNAGVEFAQRWILVEEELPEEFDTVLVKDSNGCIALSTILVSNRIGKYFSVDSGGVENVRYCRPIEIK